MSASRAASPAASVPRWMPVILALAALLAYSNSFSGVFVFDDTDSILNNPSITRLWPLPGPLAPPAALTVGGRPVFNLTLAINHALGGLNPWGYHAVNLAILLCSALVLLGVARRTLLQPVLRDRFGPDADRLAFFIALLWMLHPVLTGCVTYISQRSEALMGLFYLLTLYGFIHATGASGRSWPWVAVAVASCYLGMLTKEVMATAPLAVLLYDRTFLAGSFREAWRQRWRLHAALMAGWLPLVYAWHDSGARLVGTGHGVSAWSYALTECRAIPHYLALAAWPHPLILDYGTDFATSLLDVLPGALVVAVLLAVTALALARRPALGFIGAWFFLVLAPTSSFIPVVKAPIGDNRLYLPLISLVVLLVLGLHAWLGRKSRPVFLALTVVWGVLTFLRNDDYASKTTLWQETVAARPDNAQAFCDYGEALAEEGRDDEALAAFGQSLRLRPDYPEAEVNDGFILMQEGRPNEAIPHFQHALLLNPGFAEAQNNWGNALAQMHRYADAIAHYEEAIRLNSGFAIAHYNCGNMYLKLGKLPEGFAEYREALRCQPDFPEVRYNWGNVLLNHGRPAEAIEQYREALRLRPQWVAAHTNLGLALAATGDAQGALGEFKAALQIDPNDQSAQANLMRLQALLPASSK